MGGFTVRAPVAKQAADYTGDAYLDHGSQCDGKVGGDCFLSDAARIRILGDFRSLVDNANGNYKQALLELKFQALITKDAEMPWYVALALDLISMHIAGTLAKGLTAARNAGATRLIEMGLHDAQTIGYNASSWSSKAETVLNRMTPEHLKQVTTSAFEPIKAGVKKGVQRHFNEAPESEKAGTVSYLDQLRDGCDRAFRSFALSTSGRANDAEILAMWHGMDPDLHSVGVYKAMLSAQLARFKNSGANDIGHRKINIPGGTIDRVKRVVYVRDIHGTLIPWFQNADRDEFVTGVSGGTMALDTPRQLSLESRIPEEFRDIAIQRSEAMFGPTPILDDGFVSQLKNIGQDPTKVRQSMYLSPPTKHKPSTVVDAVMEVFGHYTDPPPLAPPAVPPSLPSGSVFADPSVGVKP